MRFRPVATSVASSAAACASRRRSVAWLAAAGGDVPDDDAAVEGRDDEAGEVRDVLDGAGRPSGTGSAADAHGVVGGTHRLCCHHQIRTHSDSAMGA